MTVTIDGTNGVTTPDVEVSSGGSASAPAITISGDTNTGIFFPAADTIAFAEGGAEAMRIDSGGNVAIGATSVTSGVRLDVVSADSSQQFVNVLKLKTTNTGDVHPAILFENNRGSVSNAFQISLNSGTSAGTSLLTFIAKDSGGTFNRVVDIENNGDFQFNSGYGSVATAYGCRAWVNFNGTGTPAIREDGNVSSITDNGTGDYTVNFTTAMPDVNYSVASAGQWDTFAGGYAQLVVNVARQTTGYQTGSVRLQTGSNVAADPEAVNIAIFR